MTYVPAPMRQDSARRKLTSAARPSAGGYNPLKARLPPLPRNCGSRFVLQVLRC